MTVIYKITNPNNKIIIMKNIHILPTDKPSKLYIINSIGKLDWSKDYLQQVDNGTNKHIYITSDEEVKANDWFIDDCESDAISILYKCLEIKPLEYIRTEFDKHDFKDCKKIILTTDLDLIKNGVQAIDDEFLEWFVRNPSCEEVEIQKWFDGLEFLEYKIIIPKEESRFITVNVESAKGEDLGKVSYIPKEEPKTKCYCGHTSYCDCGPLEPKQETLSWDELVKEAGSEEELVKILKLPHIAPLVREAMINNRKK